MARTLGRSRLGVLSVASVGVAAILVAGTDVTGIARADATAVHGQSASTKLVPGITGTVTDQASPPNDLGDICVRVLPTVGGTAVGHATTSTTNGT
jgi:hypothetical protein